MRVRNVRARGAGALAVAIGALAVPGTAWAHPGRASPASGLLHHWGGAPGELLLILGPALWYAVGTRALWASAGAGRGVSPAQALCFSAGILALIVALASPLDAMADALFSAHMVQHLLLILIAAPLLVLGAPVLAMLWALPRSSRAALGRWWIRRTALRSVAHALMHPGSVFALHLVAIWFWHLPVPYQAALRNPATHALEHLSFLGTALLFWWCIAPPTGRPRARDGVDVLLVGGTLMQSGVLGAALVFARSPWYPDHAAGARAWGTTLLDDQQLAGLLMWIPASVVYVGAAAWLFLRWFQGNERAVTAAERPYVARRLQQRPQEVA